jgi:hypothetical protein
LKLVLLLLEAPQLKMRTQASELIQKTSLALVADTGRNNLLAATGMNYRETIIFI